MSKIAQYRINNLYIDNPFKIGDFKLIQAGSLYCDSGEEKPEHFHLNWFEFTITTDGVGYVSTNGVETKVQKGDIYFSYPCDRHRIRSSKEHPLHYDFFSFIVTNQAYINELEDIMAIYTPENRKFCESHIPGMVSDFLIEIDNESNGAKYSKTLLELLLKQIYIYTIRAFDKKQNYIIKNRNTLSRSELLCHRMMNYIDTHIYTMEDLTELSKETKYSYGYLTTLFKQITGQTLTGYYQSKKLEIAKLLILEEKLKITQISDLLNYSSLYSFSRAFKNRFGISPKKYVSSEKNKNS